MNNRPLPADARLIPEEAKLVFKGTLFDMYQWEQEMFDGSFQTFEMLRRPDAALIIGIDDSDEIILLDEQQPGNPVTYNRLPGGQIESNESVLDGAKREMEEETGLSFAKWSLLEVIQPAVKIEWFIYVYVATAKIKEVKTAHEVGEKITIKRVSFDEFKDTQDGRIDALRGVKSIDELLEKVGLK